MSNSTQRLMPINRQRSLAGRYPRWLKGVSLLAFGWAFLGWLNETWFFQFHSPIWLNRYTEYALIFIFGLWRVTAEKNPYTRQRLIILIANVTLLWWLIPWLLPFIEPYIGYLGALPAFPSLHTPGTLTFFLVLGAVFLFGRRVICGWNCPCVAIREVVGFPFRQIDHRPNGPWAWRLRHLKWLWFALYLGAMVAMSQPANNLTMGYLGFFALMVGLPYFLSMLLSPWIGNRGYCRYLCPFGATFGILNKAGLFHISYQADRCTQCGLCTKVCDMSIPVWEMGAATGAIDTTECMGCGRCVTECPTETLAFFDLRNLIDRSLQQNRSHLLQKVDWHQPHTRLRALLFAWILIMILIGAWQATNRIGTNHEWLDNLRMLWA